MTTTNIYILRLAEGKYYVGKSDNVLTRLQQHMNGNGSAWTQKYKPVALEKTMENVSPFDEDKITKEYMSKYGIDNVRGGSYVQIELSKFHLDALKMELWSTKDLCTRCGRAGHFIKDCYAKSDALGNKINDTETTEKKELPTDLVKSLISEIKKEAVEFMRNLEDKCVEKKTEKKHKPRAKDKDTNEWGCDYCDRTFTTKFGCNVHEKSCKEKNPLCFRCGRDGHVAKDCYAKTNVSGKRL